MSTEQDFDESDAAEDDEAFASDERYAWWKDSDSNWGKKVADMRPAFEIMRGGKVARRCYGCGQLCGPHADGSYPPACPLCGGSFNPLSAAVAHLADAEHALLVAERLDEAGARALALAVRALADSVKTLEAAAHGDPA